MMIKIVQINIGVIGARPFRIENIHGSIFILFLSVCCDALAERSRLFVVREKIKSLINQTKAKHPTSETKVKKNTLQKSYWLINVLVCLCVCSWVCLVRVLSLFVCQSSSMLHSDCCCTISPMKPTVDNRIHYTYFECNYDCYLYLLHS